MDNKLRKHYILETMNECTNGIYNSLPIDKSQKNFFNENFNIAPPVKYCDVEVIRFHAIDISYGMVKQGLKPLLINIVMPDFSGSNLEACTGIKDECIVLRTNFFKTINTFGLYPIDFLGVVYSPVVHIVRNDSMQFLEKSNVFNVSLATFSIKPEPEIKKELLVNNEYFIMKKTIETIFQTAISYGNDCIIFNDLGCISYNYPISDICLILNGCIYKYGHLFKKIIVAILLKTQSDMGYLNAFDNLLIKPQKFLIPRNVVSAQN